MSIIIFSVFLFWIYKADIAFIYSNLHERKSKQLDLLIQNLDNNNLSDNVKFAIKENIEAQLFYKSHGIIADKPFRDALTELNIKHPLDARWFYLRRAYPFMSLDALGNIELKVSRGTLWLNKIITSFAFLTVSFGALSIFSLLFLITFQKINLIDGIYMIALGMVILLMGIYFHWTTWGRDAAIKLARIVNNKH